jgi:hypothetical protein
MESSKLLLENNVMMVLARMANLVLVVLPVVRLQLLVQSVEMSLELATLQKPAMVPPLLAQQTNSKPAAMYAALQSTANVTKQKNALELLLLVQLIYIPLMAPLVMTILPVPETILALVEFVKDREDALVVMDMFLIL